LHLAVGGTLDLGVGGGIFNNEETVTNLANCIVWGNQPDQIAGAPVTVSHSCQEGGLTSAGNIEANPLFARMPSMGIDQTWGTDDDDYGDLRVAMTSPCIDAGNSLAIPASVVFDLVGAARTVDVASIPDTGVPNPRATVIDMGAREFVPPSCPADISPVGPPVGNGLVNVDDLLAVINNWGDAGLPGLTPGDVDFNGVVNVDDVLTVINAWGVCPKV